MVELVDVGERVVDPQTTQRRRGDDRQGQQGDEAGTNAPVAQGYS
ncbi:hypothetical protein [Streptomyces klenkii]